jgi:ATP-binding cassette subfamily B protein
LLISWNMKKFWKTIWFLTDDNHALYIWSLVVQLFMVVSQIFLFYLSKVLVDALTPSGSGFALDQAQPLENAVVNMITLGQGKQLIYDKPWILAIVIVVAGVVTALMSFYRMWLRSQTTAYINKTMQLSLFDHLERLPYSFYKKNKPGDMIQTCTRDCDVVRKFIIADISSITYTFYIVVICFAILMSISWKLTLVSLSPFPFMFVYSFFLIKIVRKRYRATDDSEAVMTDKISENLNAVRIVKAYNNERYEINEFEKTLTDYRHKFIHWRKMSSFFFSSSDIFVFGAKTLSLIFSLYLCFQDPTEVSPGTVVLAVTYVNMMVWPLRDVATILSNLGQSLASVDRINKILDEPIEDTTSGVTTPIHGNIVFDHTGFSYEDSKTAVIHDISFEIKAGQTVAIMGKTGSGKSTLSQLLTRLYDYTSGSIKVDGVELKDIQKAYLRRNIVPVLQDPFLFSKTIYENIRLANKKATMEDVKWAANIASVDATIASFKDGYDTPVGEKGVTLSGGQKQRVAIARTIMSNAPVLIFDDSLSAVDTETDLAIRSHLKQLKNNTTTILITHRVSTAKDADLIVVLDEGRVAEIGTHDELVAKPGLYQRIYTIQSRMV